MVGGWASLDSGFIRHFTLTCELGWRLELETCFMRDCRPGRRGGEAEGLVSVLLDRGLLRALLGLSP